MERTIKMKLLPMFLIITILAGLFNPSIMVFAQSGNNIVSENEAAFYEITSQVSEDSQSATVNLKLTPKEDVEVKQITLPDSRTVEYQNQDIAYVVQENGNITFTLHYILNEEERRITIDYEVTEIRENQTDSETNEANEENTEETVQETVQVENQTTDEVKSDTEKINNILSISSPEETAYYGPEMITSNIILDGSRVSTPLESVVLEVELPATRFSGSDLKTESFIDYVSMSLLSELGSSPQVITQDEKTKIRMTLTV